MATHRHPEFESEINVRKPHGRIFLRWLSRMLGYALLAAGLVALARDLWQAATWSFKFLSFREVGVWWTLVDRTNLNRVSAWIHDSFGSALDGAFLAFLQAPLFAVLCGPGLLLLYLGHRPRR